MQTKFICYVGLKQSLSVIKTGDKIKLGTHLYGMSERKGFNMDAVVTILNAGEPMQAGF